MGLALKEATKRSIDSLAKVYNPLKGLYSIYLNVDSDVSASFICQFGRHYNVNTRDKNVTLTFSSLGSAVEGQRIGIKNNGDTGELKINSGVGHTIDNLNELVLLVGDYVEIMKTSESNSIIISKYKA